MEAFSFSENVATVLFDGEEPGDYIQFKLRKDKNAWAKIGFDGGVDFEIEVVTSVPLHQYLCLGVDTQKDKS